MIRSFVFDFDGVIADTETLWFASIWDCARRYGLATDYQTLISFAGDGDVTLFEHLRELLVPDEFESFVSEAQQILSERAQNLAIRPGIQTYINFAKTHDLKLGIASNSTKEYIKNWLQQLGLSNNTFDVIASRDNVADISRLKPEPDIYLHAAKHLGIQPHEAIAFEDSILGLRGAASAGFFPVAFANEVTRPAVAQTGYYKADLNEIAPRDLLEQVSGSGGCRVDKIQAEMHE